MWILLGREKLPVTPAPPALSIFWSTPWPKEEYLTELNSIIEKHKKRFEIDLRSQEPIKKRAKRGQSLDPLTITNGFDAHAYIADGGNSDIYTLLAWKDARKIHYKGVDIRVFPHDFTIPSEEGLTMFIIGDGDDSPSHELVASNVAEDKMLNDIMNGEQRLIYDAALLDGANPTQALLTAMGEDITLPDVKIPAIGWYKVRPEYGLYYCSAEDLSED